MEFIVQDNGSEMTVLIMRGRFSFADSKSFMAIAESTITASLKGVVFDLREVEFIDSSALGILLLSRDRSQKAGKDLILKGPKGQVRQILENARFDTVFEIED